MFAALNQALRQLVQTGNLTVTDIRGRKHIYGDGSGKPSGFKIVNPRAPMKILLDPDRYFGELYMAGLVDNKIKIISDTLAGMK